MFVCVSRLWYRSMKMRLPDLFNPLHYLSLPPVCPPLAPFTPASPPPVSGEFSALQEEEGEEEQEFADDPILQLDMKVRQPFTECVRWRWLVC